VVTVAMNRVPAALRHGIDQPTASLPELGLKSRAGHLKFLDHVFAELEGNAGTPNLLLKERVVVVHPVNRVVVEVAGNSVEADHAKVAVGGGPRRQQRKIREIAPV